VQTADGFSHAISPWHVVQIQETPTPVAFGPAQFSLRLAAALARSTRDPRLGPLWDLRLMLDPTWAEPMDLQFIFNRLSAGWYRTPGGFSEDVQKLGRIVAATEDPGLVQTMSYVREMFKAAIQAVTQP
jgi:hypothetical protein